VKRKISFSSVLAELEMVKAQLDSNERLMNVYNIFESNCDTPGIVITKNGSFYRMLSKARFFQVMSKQYMFDLFSRRSVQFFFDDYSSENYLIFEETVSIIEAAKKALLRADKERNDPIIIITSQKEYKLISMQTLLLAQNEIQTNMLAVISETNEFKKEVLQIVAHDLRNPLSVIIGFSKLLMYELKESEKSYLYSTQISSAANNMNNLINDFLVAAINDTTDIELHYSIFNIRQYIESTIKSFENLYLAKQQELIFETFVENILVNADKNKIIEVLENLISNAIKYSNFGGKINVSLFKENENAIIKVADEGPGLTDYDKGVVFNKFQKLSAKPTGNETSTGLGLYIVKRIIERHEGKIWVESEYGKGSSFFVALPNYADNIKVDEMQISKSA